jgi:hypothetical protein
LTTAVRPAPITLGRTILCGWADEALAEGEAEELDGRRGPLATADLRGGQAMMQLARRASLVVVLLLASVATATAECAWALWINPTFDAAGWRLANGAPAWYASKAADCTSTATYKQAGTSSQPGDVMCLPQGVEPSGKTGSYEYRPWRGR